jgi:phage portal protein BeeE
VPYHNRMGFLSRLFGVSEVTLEAARGPQFAIGTEDVDPAVFGLTYYEPSIAVAPRISRREAIQVPAVKRGRDLIAGTIGTLPFQMVDTENVRVISSLLGQPEANVPRSITMTLLVEDLLFEQHAWWRVVGRDYRGYPNQVVRLLPRTVQVEADGKVYVNSNGSSQGNSWEYVEHRDLIHFISPTDGILDSGARAIRTYLKLATAADRYADEPLPSGYFTPKDGADPEDEEVQDALNKWGESRRIRSTGYVNAALDYNTVQWSPEQLQMSEARQHAVLEISRLMGIDPEDLGVSTTSRTYQNSQDRRLAMINDVLGMYVSAIVERLSMQDITPRGYRVVADFNGFLRADDKTRYEVYGLAKNLGVIDRYGIAEREGIPAPTFPEPTPAPAALPAQVEE